MTLKPIKRGIQFFILCDSVSSYYLKFIIYTGWEDRFVSGEGFTFNIVNELLSDYLYNHHIVYTDNYYTSLKLARYLLSTGTDLIVTIRRTSRGFPRIDTVRFCHCDSFKVTSTDGIVVRRYIDKRDVYSLSTRTKGNDVASRFNIIERIMKPAMIIEYNQHMGGVDQIHQSYYGVGRSSKKYWKLILFNIFNIAIINSFILF